MGLTARFEKALSHSEKNEHSLVENESSSMSLRGDVQNNKEVVNNMLVPRLQLSVAPHSSPVLNTPQSQVTPPNFNENGGSPAAQKASLSLAQLNSVTSMKDSSTHHQLSD